MEIILSWLLMFSLIAFAFMLLFAMLRNTFKGVDTSFSDESDISTVKKNESKSVQSINNDKTKKSVQKIYATNKNTNSLSKKTKVSSKINSPKYTKNYKHKYNSYKEYKQKNNISR